MLKNNRIKTIRPYRKLIERFVGPFQVIEWIIISTHRLDLKNLVGKIHDKFHIEKLEKAKPPQEGHQDYDTIWSVYEEESLKFLVDDIDSKYNDGIFEYRILWTNNTKEWIRKTAIDNSDIDIDIMIKEFHIENPDKPYLPGKYLERNYRPRWPPPWYSI